MIGHAPNPDFAPVRLPGPCALSQVSQCLVRERGLHQIGPSCAAKQEYDLNQFPTRCSALGRRLPGRPRCFTVRSSALLCSILYFDANHFKAIGKLVIRQRVSRIHVLEKLYLGSACGTVKVAHGAK